MNTVNLYIGVGLKEGFAAKDLSFIVEASEEVGLDILRDADDSTDEFLIDSENTFIIGRKKEKIDTGDFPIILELSVALDEDVNPDDLLFTIFDHEFEDGFSVVVTKNKVGEIDWDLIIANDSFITSRLVG